MFDKKLLSTILVFTGILLVIYMLQPLIPAFCLALILIYVANPLTDLLQKYIKRRFFAASASFLLMILSFLVLTILLLGEVLSEAARLPEYLQSQQFFVDLNLFQQVSPGTLIQNLLTENGVKLLIQIVVQLGNIAIQVFFGVLISFFVVWKDLHLPVKDEKLREMLRMIDRGMHSVIVSLFLTAVITGLISIPIYYVFGLPYPLLLAALTGFLALLPLIGPYLLYIPVAGYLFLSGETSKSVIFLVLCVVFISVLPDILVRPLMGKTKEVGAVPLLIGFVSGLLVFGASGIVLGPLIVIATIAFWKVYLEE